MPAGLSPFDAMAIGTAGFTAALSIVEMERNGLTPSNGPVIVTGATGGVGSIAIQSLAARGYSVTALTGKAQEADYLRSLGATDVLARGSLEMGTRPLEKSMWAGAVDPVGGDMLAWLTRTMMLRRLHREFRTDRRHRAPDDRAAVHPARREAARDRFGDVPGSDAPRGLAVALPAT